MATPSVLVIRPARVTRLIRVTPELFTLSCVLTQTEPFPFKAGQWVYLHLLSEQGESLARGAFSFASAPVEGKTELEFGIKIYGRLTETLSQLSEGMTIGVQGPFGIFTLPKQPTPLVFFAGGIGITPFRSLIREALATDLQTPIALIWLSKSWDDLLYHQEFLAWEAASNGRFLYRPTLTRDAHPDWTGWRGRMESWMLETLPLDWAQAEAYLCGPTLFMERAKTLLKERGIAGRPRLHEERFS